MSSYPLDHLTSAFDQLPEPIALIESDTTHIIFANPAFQKLFSLPSSYLTSPISLCSLLLPVYLQCPFQETQSISYTVYAMQSLSGQLLRVVINISPLFGTPYRLVFAHDLSSIERSKLDGQRILLSYSRSKIGLAKFIFSPIGPTPEAWVGLDFLDDPHSLLSSLGVYYMSTIQNRKGLFGPFPVKDHEDLSALVYSFDIDVRHSSYDAFDSRLGFKLPSLILFIYPKYMEQLLNRTRIESIISKTAHNPQYHSPSADVIKTMLETILKHLLSEYTVTSYKLTLEDKLNLINQLIDNYSNFPSLGSFFDHITQVAKQVLSFEHFTLWQVDHSLNALRLVRYFGYSENLKDLTISLESNTKSIVSRCARMLTVQNVPDVRKDPDYLEGQPNVLSELAVPIISPISGKLVGVLNIESETLNNFSEEDTILAQAFASRISLFMEKESTETIFYSLNRLITELYALESIDFRSIANIITNFVQKTFNFKLFSILQLNKESGYLYVVDSIGYDDTVFDVKLTLNPPEGIIGHAAAEKRTYNIGDVSTIPYYVAVDPNIKSELAVPIILDGEVIGAINLESYSLNAFSSTDERLLESIANLCALVLKCNSL